MTGGCLAGDKCMFSHDPSTLMSRLNMEDTSSYGGTPPFQHAHPAIQIQDYEAFPSLQSVGSQENFGSFQSALEGAYTFQGTQDNRLYMQGISSGPSIYQAPSPNRSFNSRPGSRHQSPAPASPRIPSVNDDEAFPTLSSAKATKKHHGKRGGHGHHHNKFDNKEQPPGSLADVVRASSSTPSSPNLARKALARNNRSFTGASDQRAMRIPEPKHVPWLETGEVANRNYLKARAEAIRHGGFRNKFLQR